MTSLSEASASRRASREVLPWLSVLRLLCALEIVGFHWLRANFRLGLFGCAGALNVVADYQDTHLGFRGFAPVLSQACNPHATAVVSEVLGVLFGFGWEAVNVFIVISGFVLALGLPSVRPGKFWLQWYSRRLARILLPYYKIALPFITAFILLLHVPGRSSGVLSRFQAKLSTLFSGSIVSTYLTHVFLIDPTRKHWAVSFFSPAWWFVPAILVAYLCFPLFVTLAEKLGTTALLSISFVITVCAYKLTASGLLVNNAWYFVVLNESFSFSLGVATGSLWRNPERRDRLQRSIASPRITALGIALVIFGNVSNWFHDAYPFSSPVFTIGLCLLGFQVAVHLARIYRIRELASLDAYILYLLHQPLATPLAVLSVMLLHGKSVILGLPCYLAACCGLTWVVQRLAGGQRTSGPFTRSAVIRPAGLRSERDLAAMDVTSNPY